MNSQLTADRVLSHLVEQDLVDLTARLVSVPSVSGQERLVMDAAHRYLEGQGIDARILSRDAERPNLVVTVGSGSPILVINGHLDTVPVSNAPAWKSDPHTLAMRDGRLHGLGALDMKGPCAVMMLVVALLHRHVEHLRGSLQLQLVSDEEDGAFYGTIYMIEQMKAGQLPRPDMVLMSEYSGLRLITSERGTFKFEVTFHGQPTHTAMARVDGVNPIAHAARAVLALEKPLQSFHPDIGYGIISVNMIKAGTFPSQVPDTCTLLVDRRMLPGETDETCLADAELEIREALKDYPEARFELKHMVDRNGRRRYSPPNVTPWNSPLVQAVANAHQAVTGAPAERFVDWYGATDGRLFRYEGIDVVNYGPCGQHAHGANEYVELASLVTQLRVLVTAALQVLS